MLKLAYLSAASFFRRNRKKYAATSAGTIRRSKSISGHKNFMASSQVLRQASARRQLAPSLAQVSEAQNCIDEFSFWEHPQPSPPRLAKPRPKLLPPPLRQSRKALPEG